MSYDQWCSTKNSDDAALKECWDEAQAEILKRVEEKLGDNYGFVGGRFYPHLKDIVKDLT